jgi:hypothetical protein
MNKTLYLIKLYLKKTSGNLTLLYIHAQRRPRFHSIGIDIKPLSPELNPICLLALLAHWHY